MNSTIIIFSVLALAIMAVNATNNSMACKHCAKPSFPIPVPGLSNVIPKGCKEQDLTCMVSTTNDTCGKFSVKLGQLGNLDFTSCVDRKYCDQTISCTLALDKFKYYDNKAFDAIKKFVPANVTECSVSECCKAQETECNILNIISGSESLFSSLGLLIFALLIANIY